MTVTFLSSSGIERSLRRFPSEQRGATRRYFEQPSDQRDSDCKSLCQGGCRSARRASLLTQFSAKSIDRKVRVLSKKIE